MVENKITTGECNMYIGVPIKNKNIFKRIYEFIFKKQTIKWGLLERE